MSNPQNILAKYRTYSYHHILIACDNEASANFIRNSNRLSVFRDLSAARPVTIDETTKKVQVDEIEEATGKPNREQVGAYVVILNGMIDTTFVVKDVEWFSATGASTDRQDAFTSIAVEGSMTVEEPRGVRFLNALNGACDLLQSDPTGVIWVLKTIFIGHNDDGSSSEYITDLRPLEFMMYNVTGTFSIEGGVYKIEFAGVSNGASRFPQFSRLAKEITIRMGGDSKLVSALKDLEGQMNAKSEKNWECVTDAFIKAYPDINQNELKEFRKVRYSIVPDKLYEGDEYKINTLNASEQDTINPESSGGTIKNGPKSTVEQAIRNIMQRCDRVLKDRTEGVGEHKYIFKIHSEITMVGKDAVDPVTGVASNEAFVAVVYRIRQHAELTNQVVKRVLAGDKGIPGEDTEVTLQKLEENTIIYDYFFTGKNTDVLDFDLKMDMGLAFLQTLSSTNNKGSGTYQIAGTDTVDLNSTVVVGNENDRGDPAVGADGKIKPKILVRSKTPIFPATNVNNVFSKNVRGALDSTLYGAFLSRHAALESVECKLSVHGNPYLMSQTNRKPSETQRRGNASESADVTNVMSNWETLPGLAKINIYMPASSDTPSDRDAFVRERFWYDGYYYIFGIDHKFSDGTFTQDLHLVALPNESLLGDTQHNDITLCGTEEVKKEDNQQSSSSGDAGANQGTTEGVRISEAEDSWRRGPMSILGVRGDGVT